MKCNSDAKWSTSRTKANCMNIIAFDSFRYTLTGISVEMKTSLCFYSQFSRMRKNLKIGRFFQSAVRHHQLLLIAI